MRKYTQTWQINTVDVIGRDKKGWERISTDTRKCENFLLKFAAAMEARRPHTHIPLSFYNVLVKEL